MRRPVATALVVALLLGAGYVVVATSSPLEGIRADLLPGADEFGIGVDAAGLDDVRAKGKRAQYALVWALASQVNDGFADVRPQVERVYREGAIPVVQWYYWGDDIRVSCFTSGCNGKSKDEWFRAGGGLAWMLADVAKGRRAIVVVETEFNKADAREWEPLDAMLEAQAQMFRARGIEVAMGFGAWGEEDWWRFDRAARASDYVSVQMVRSAKKHSEDEMLRSAEDAIEAARRLNRLFGAPVLVSDFAVSSWGEKEWVQEREVNDALADRERLRRAGIVAFVYRAVKDDPAQPWGYHEEAERHWGLVHADGRWKPAMGELVRRL